MPSARELAKKAKISPATLYRHHKNVYEIMPDLEKYALKKYKRQMWGVMRRPRARVRTLLGKLVIFILKHQELFRMIVERGCEGTFEKMVEVVMPRIKRELKLPKNSEEAVKIYENEVAAVLEVWIRGGYKRSEAEVLRDMMYLMQSLKERMRGIIGK